MKQEEHEAILKEVEEKNFAEVEELKRQIVLKDEALAAKDEEIKKLDKEILDLNSKISEFEKASKEEAPKKAKKVQFVGLITSIYHNGKKIPEGTAKEDVPKELQEKFSQFFKIIEK